MIFQTITSLTYAVLLNTGSLSLSEKQDGSIQTMTLSQSVGWAAAPEPQAHPSPGVHNHLLSAASHDASCTRRGPGIGSGEAAGTSVAYGGQNCLWQPPATHGKFIPCTSRPEAQWPENPTKWETSLIKSHLLNHLPELQPAQFRNTLEIESTHKYWELIVRTSFASQGTCGLQWKAHF